MDDNGKQKRPRYLLPVLSVALGLFLAVLGVTQAGSLREDFLTLVAKFTAQEVVNKNPDLFILGDEEVAGGSGDALAVRQFTGLFDLTLKDGDGTDSGQSHSERLITGDLYESAGTGSGNQYASSTLASVRNTFGQRQLICAGDAGMQVFASSSNAANKDLEYRLTTSTVSALTEGTAGADTKAPLLAFHLTANTLTQAGRVITASATGIATAAGFGNGCAVWEPNDYLLLNVNNYTDSESATSSAGSGVASSSFFYVKTRTMATSS